jgi:tetratricopeptide (TPR) repeat protein
VKLPCVEVGALLVVVVGCGGRTSASVDETRCRDAYAAEHWEQAAADCTRAAAQPDRPELIVLAARALVQAKHDPDEVLAVVERGFGTSVDAAAWQIAGMQRIRRGEHAEGQRQLGKALSLHRAAGDHRESARDAHSLAGSFLQERRLNEAIDAASTCLREAQIAGDQRFQGFAYRAQAEAFTAIGDANAARDALVQAASSLLEWPQDHPWVLLSHGKLVLELGDTSTAADLLSRALDAAEQVHLTPVVDAAHLNLARAEHALRHLDAAQRHVDALTAKTRASPVAGYVAGLIAADRGDAAAAEALLANAAAHATDDDNAADIAYQQGALATGTGDLKAARTFYRKSVGIVEDIRQRTGIPELRTWMLARRREPYEALFALLASQNLGSESLRSEALEVAELLHARTWLDVVVTATAPRSRTSLRGIATAKPLLADEILAAVGNREVLIYVSARGALWRVHVDGENAPGQQIIEIARLPDDVGSLLASWRDQPDDLGIAEKLGRRLVPARLVASGRPLYLVAPDRLADVPFAALRPSQRPLAADRPLVRLPGIAALVCRPHPPARDTPVLLADAHDNLPCARDEVAHAANIVHGQTYLGAKATIANAASAHGARLFHAAVHALVGVGGGALDLADGRLTTDEIIARRIQPYVAVLAGCKTGVSNDDEGWGALPSAFLVAGTQTVVATLRPVDDRDAASVMKAFYEAGGAEHPVTALAEAQRKLANNHVAPHSWAWFAAWGHAEPDECGPAAAAPP